ncbi:unnamed protein product [Rhizophagus irregularis]|uniref:Putative restriction endonuclease domain-containing protein n=1 Tax=Rhizophagus irregularis TaxID=588596 RepID=A0A2I1E5U4_9GLOM|nr:DUF820-domain-containing protein [Rhizophagus irregularis]CAB5363369.1 unnamed protein product [Rhizophagus irregularis]
MSEFTYEELAPHYQLDRNSLEITRVDCVPVTLEDFKEITKKLPPSHNLELAANKITVKMPVSALTGQREAYLIGRITVWCENNPLLVGLVGSSNVYYNLPLPNPTVRSPDASVILAARWGALTRNEQEEAFPSVTPNFVAEVRSVNDSWQFCHDKMLVYMDAGVDEGILIDPIDRTLTCYRISRNNIVWETRNNPRSFTSRILNGFVLNLNNII